MCLKVKNLPSVPENEKVQVSEYVVSFAYTLKNHLRDTKPAKRLPGVKKMTNIDEPHLPVQVSRFYLSPRPGLVSDRPHRRLFAASARSSHARLHGRVRCLRAHPQLAPRPFLPRLSSVRVLPSTWPHCPGIRPRHCPSTGVCLLSFSPHTFLIGLELIAEDIEDPFGFDGDDLPLDLICDKIRTVITQIMHERDGKAKEDKLKYTMSSQQIVVDDPLYEHKIKS